jgi:multiple antibiotic resistance protein
LVEIAVSVFAALFSVVNPMGAVPVFLSMTPTYTKHERNRSALMTSIYFVSILLVFFVAGSAILSFFGITLPAIQIAGGLIIFGNGTSLLKGKFAESRAINKKVKEEALQKEDISFTPMAMPLLSGPGSISLLIGMYNEYPAVMERVLIGLIVVLTGFTVYLILRTSPYLFKLLGVAGLKAISRIMGFLVMAIGIQYVATGLLAFLNN